jgi:dipeptidase D
VKVSGLLGGHSGVDIHKGRGNAVRILARVMQTLQERLAFDVADIRGGTVRNAIPRDAAALVLLDPARQAEFEQLLAQTAAEIRAELGSFDPALQIIAEPAERPARVLEPADVKRIIDLLVSLPDGVLAMSPDIPGLVQTSTNVGTISIDEAGNLESNTLQRSSVESSKFAAGRAVATVARLTGFQVEVRGGYPGWKPEPNSDVVRIMKQLHQELFGKPTELVAMHAGLECGVIGEKHPGMQMISFGPQIVDPHSPNERVEIPSVETFWKYLRALLEKI